MGGSFRRPGSGAASAGVSGPVLSFARKLTLRGGTDGEGRSDGAGVLLDVFAEV